MATLAPAIAPPEEPAVRLVGLVRKAGVVKAVLKVRGETVVVAAGEAAGDYRVLAIDDDGVRLQAKDGTTVMLPAGGS
jgi:Tfp pilus assembly protein PilP